LPNESPLIQQYNVLFPNRCAKKPVDLTTVDGARGAVVKMLRDLFGAATPKDWSKDMGTDNRISTFPKSSTKAKTVMCINAETARKALAIARPRYEDAAAKRSLDGLLHQRHGCTDPERFCILHAKTLAVAQRKASGRQPTTPAERTLLKYHMTSSTAAPPPPPPGAIRRRALMRVRALLHPGGGQQQPAERQGQSAAARAAAAEGAVTVGGPSRIVGDESASWGARPG
jgi:hypothetical protein